KFPYALQRINAYRAAVANGLMSTPEGVMPGCTTMFALVLVTGKPEGKRCDRHGVGHLDEPNKHERNGTEGL
ncbi:hypothetical protein GCK32_010892, partial [Trichostrongylus colubriformis]